MAKQTMGEFLSTLRHAYGYTQQQVADKLSVSNRTVSSWETGNAMPDIILLPAIAELYNVTVDEILRGERIEGSQPMPEFTPKALAAVYKHMKTSFVWQTYVLLCIFVAAFVTLYVGLLKLDFTLLLIGIIASGISIIVFVALCIYVEHAIDDNDDVGRKMCILIRRQIAICVYTAGALSFITLPINMGLLIFNIDYGVQLAIVCTPISAIFFIVGRLVQINTIKKWGNEQMLADYKSNRKLAGKLALFGTIPLVVAITLTTVFSCVSPTITRTIYENENREEFREYLETFVIAENSFYTNIYGMKAGEYKLNLTELSQNATNGEAIHIDEDTTLIYGNRGCTVRYQYVGYSAKKYTYDDFVVYNLRFSSEDSHAGEYFYGYIISVNEVIHLQERGEGMALVKTCEYELSTVFVMVGFAIIFADIAVMTVIYFTKKKINRIKL